MAEYNGFIYAPPISAISIFGSCFYGDVHRRYSKRSEITDEKAYEGEHSIKLRPGYFHVFDYGFDAGEATFSVWCWPPRNGVCLLEVLKSDGCILAYSKNVGTQAWEKITVNFTADKKVYVCHLCNYTLTIGGNGPWMAYFDKVE